MLQSYLRPTHLPMWIPHMTASPNYKKVTPIVDLTRFWKVRKNSRYPFRITLKKTKFSILPLITTAIVPFAQSGQTDEDMASHEKRKPSITDSVILKWRLLTSGKFILPIVSNLELLLIPFHQCAVQLQSWSHPQASIKQHHGRGGASSPSPPYGRAVN
jgi:hypothetical protein